MDTIDKAVPTGVMLRYGCGQLGAQIFRDTPAVLLPIFMTTMLGVPAWLSGLVILVPKLWVIVCDPMVGAWSDRLKPSLGRAPFLIAGALLTSVCFFMLFLVTGYSSPTIAAVAICLLFLVASTAFSVYSVPYLAIAAELSSDPHERTRILVFRMLFTTVGVLVGVGVAQPLVFAFGGGARGWHVMAGTLTLVCLASMLVPALGLRRIRLLPGGASPARLSEQMRPIFANRPFMTLLATCFVQGIGQASGYTVIGFVFLYALDAIWLVLPFVVTVVAASALSQPLWLHLSRRFGKVPCYVAASLGWIAVTLSWFWARPDGATLVVLPVVGALSTQHLLVLVRAILIGVTNSGFLLLAMSLMTDTIDDQRRRFGLAHEGVFSGVFSAAEKLAFALGPLVAGLVLSWFGFASSSGGAGAQSASAVTGILLLYSFIPAATQVVSLLIFSRFRLDTIDAPIEVAQIERYHAIP